MVDLGVFSTFECEEFSRGALTTNPFVNFRRRAQVGGGNLRFRNCERFSPGKVRRRKSAHTRILTRFTVKMSKWTYGVIRGNKIEYFKGSLGGKALVHYRGGYFDAGRTTGNRFPARGWIKPRVGAEDWEYRWGLTISRRFRTRREPRQNNVRSFFPATDNAKTFLLPE